MPFSIHQFSRGIKPTKNERGEWVSGGFGAEIANESFRVPEQIQKAVNTTKKDGLRMFCIHDAYPPQPDEIALIARDLGNYCVLAVANRLSDNTTPREFVGYRYFWLDKTQFQNHPTPKNNVDGIGTLLWWWQQKGQPQYNIGELQTNRNSYTTSWDNLQKVWLLENWQQQHDQRIQSLLSDIRLNHQPLIYEATKIGYKLTYQEVHYLAIQYCNVNPGYINWAWNVRELKNTTDLKVIYCADAEAFQGFRSKFPSPVPRLTPAPATTPTPSLEEGMITMPPSSGATGSKSSGTHLITSCLGKFRGQFTEQDVFNLINFYQQYQKNIFDAVDQTEINKFLASNPPDFAIKYATLIRALVPNTNTEEIFKKLMELNEKQKRVAINFLDDLKRKAYQNESYYNFYMYFYGAISSLQDQLSNSLEPKPSIFDPYLSYLPDPIRDPIRRFLPLIFFLLLLGGAGGLIYWQRSNILSRLPWLGHPISSNNQGTKPSPPDNNAGNPQTNLIPLLDMYEKTFDAVKIGKNSKIDPSMSEFFQSLSTAIQKSTGEIRQILDGNKQLLTDLKSQDFQVIQNARKPEKYAIYKDLKQFTTLNSAKIEDLPKLFLGNNGNDALSVIMLQEALKRGSSYYIVGQQDQPGIFGEATKNAVIQAQTQAKFSDDKREGFVGKETWGNIFKYRIQDLQVEAVYQTLQTHLEQDNTNIVTEIKKCRDKHNQEKTPLHFNDCLEKIGQSPANPAPSTTPSYSTTN